MNKAVILVSFGTANLEAIKILELIEKEVKEELDNRYLVLRVFTSKVLTKILKSKYDIMVLGLQKTLFNLSNEGYDEVIVQPLHIMEGKEYAEMQGVIKEYEYSFKKIRLGRTLLGYKDGELNKACRNLVDSIKEGIPKNKHVVLVGHGSKTITSEAYGIIENMINEDRTKKVFVGTLEGERNVEYTAARVQRENIDDVILMSLLILPGNHAIRDIAGEEKSWKTEFARRGIKAEINIESLLQNSSVREIYIDKIKELIKK